MPWVVGTNAMLGEQAGRGELRRSIGLVYLHFSPFISAFSFLLRFPMPCCFRGYINYSLQGRRLRKADSPFFSIYTADTCFFLCFYPFPKSKETGQVALFSLLGVLLYYSQNQDERLSSLLILRHGCDVKGVEVNCSMD